MVHPIAGIMEAWVKQKNLPGAKSTRKPMQEINKRLPEQYLEDKYSCSGRSNGKTLVITYGQMRMHQGQGHMQHHKSPRPKLHHRRPCDIRGVAMSARGRPRIGARTFPAFLSLNRGSKSILEHQETDQERRAPGRASRYTFPYCLEERGSDLSLSLSFWCFLI